MIKGLLALLIVFLIATFPATWLLMLFLGNLGLGLSYWGTLPLGILVSVLLGSASAPTFIVRDELRLGDRRRGGMLAADLAPQQFDRRDEHRDQCEGGQPACNGDARRQHEVEGEQSERERPGADRVDHHRGDDSTHRDPQRGRGR